MNMGTIDDRFEIAANFDSDESSDELKQGQLGSRDVSKVKSKSIRKEPSFELDLQEPLPSEQARRAGSRVERVKKRVEKAGKALPNDVGSISFDQKVTKRKTKSGNVPVRDEVPSEEEARLIERGAMLEDLTTEKVQGIEEKWKEQIQTKKPRPGRPKEIPKKPAPRSTSEWQPRLEFLSDRAEADLKRENMPITRENLCERMKSLSQNREEKLTLEDLQEMYANISIDFLHKKYGIKRTSPGTRETLTTQDEKTQKTQTTNFDVVLDAVKKNIEADDLVRRMKFKLSESVKRNPIESIEKNSEGTYTLKYNQVSDDEINEYIDKLPRFNLP